MNQIVATETKIPARAATPHRAATQQRVALLIDTATTWGAGLIEGIADYAKANRRNWLFSFEPRGKYDRLLLPDGWRGDGVIARITHPGLAEQLIKRKMPAVNVSWFRYGGNIIPRCSCDEAAAAQMAARYFFDNGYRQFAYCASTLRPSYHDRLGDAFAEEIARSGFPCERFDPDHDRFEKLDSEQQLGELSRWLEGLPRPIALLAFDTIQGRQVTEACSQSGLSVPDDIAVLGGEHDELCSRISSPQLSGVDQSPQEVGARAAEMLDQLMAGQTLKDSNVGLPPKRIITRLSTDKVAIQDDMLAAAILFIRRHFANELRIRDILHEIPLSRRALEIGFRRHLGRTPRDEIRRIRVQKAQELLCDTDWPITRIATACGFDRPELLTRAFRRELKATPSEFRRRVTQGLAKR
ncbi:Xylose operon regulatory protein [Pseudobythopirellula maris]|uniref:Xylose operon regulatory protein n=2 Tax=Pseudobythopirellula maris TaxID=2527991 RepID=A0A5C5ZK74_9BACT|nr:Xylose operon regulatory protein [Pseudobythopirellula maris]